MSHHAVRATVAVVAALSLAVLGHPVPAQDIPSAHELADLRARAEVGDAQAEYNLGLMYDTGRGVPQDYAEAVRWYRLAAEQGHIEAQHQLGRMYHQGRGVPQDFPEAVAWYRQAAEQGDVEAQYAVGWMYDVGIVADALPSDPTAPGVVEAVAWYRQAAEQGYVEAQHKLGRMYHQGRGVPQDFAEAVAWYHRAAEQGLPQALWYLGDMYSDGLGVPQDFVEAHKWYNLAASRLTGDQRAEAATDRDAVAVQMTPVDLSEAQRRARQWYVKRR